MKHTLLILCSALALLEGCVTQQGATKYLDKHPGEGSAYCNRTYPTVPISKTDSSYATTDTGKASPGAQLAVNCDSLMALQRAAGKTGPVQVQCPPCPPPVNHNFYHETTTTVESTAKLAMQRDSFNKEMKMIMRVSDSVGKENKKITVQVKRLQHGRNTWRLIALSIIAYRVLIFFLSKYVPFLKFLP